MANEVEISIIAIDAASNILEKISGSLGALGEVGVAAFAAVAAAATEVVHVLSDMVDEAAKDQDVLQMFNAVLDKSTLSQYKDELLKLADAKELVTRFTHDEVIQAETVLGRYENLGGKISEVTSLSLDLATVMGTDATGAAQMLGKALEDIAGGSLSLLGRTRLLTKEEVEHAKALAASGDAAKAQAYILGILDDKIGGVAEKMGGTYAGKIKILQDVFDKWREDMGLKLLPSLTTLVEKLQALFDRYAPQVAAAFERYIVPAFTSVVQWIGTAISMLATFGPEGLIRYILGKDAGNFVLGIVSAIGGIFTKIQDGITMFQMYGPLGFIQAVFGQEAYNWVVKNVIPVIDTLVGWFHQISDWWTQNGPAIMEIGRQVWDSIVKGAQQIWQQIQTQLIPVLKEFGDHFKSLGEGGGIDIVSIIKGIAWVFENILVPAVTAAVSIVTGILTGLIGVVNALTDAFQAAASAFNSIPQNTGPSVYHPPGYAPHHAAGGPGEGWSWVGEEGPELVRLPRGSHVYSSSQSMAMAGGGGNTFVFQFPHYVGTGQDLKAAMQSAVREMQLDGRVPS